VQATVGAAIGVWFLAGAREGWFGGRLAMPSREVVAIAALCLLPPGTITDLVGLTLGAPIYIHQRIRNAAGSRATGPTRFIVTLSIRSNRAPTSCPPMATTRRAPRLANPCWHPGPPRTNIA